MGDALAGMTILVAEDDWLIADHIALALRDAGAQVRGPFASVAHLATTDVREIDAAILDVRLSDGDSYAFARALQTAGVATIFVTAVWPDEIPDDLVGVTFVGKPMDTEKLTALLASFAFHKPARTTEVASNLTGL